MRFHRKYSKGGKFIDFLIIGGHGSPVSVELGTNQAIPPPFPAQFSSTEEYFVALKDWQNSNKDSLRKSLNINDIEPGKGQGIRRAAKDWFGPGAPVLFASCHTGVGGGIAEASSEELGLNTIGPDKATNIKDVNVRFNDKGRPVFSDIDYYDSEAKAMHYAGKKEDDVN